MWHFDFGRMVLAAPCVWVLLLGVEKTGARKLVWHSDFGRMVLAGALGYVRLGMGAFARCCKDHCAE